MTIKQAREKYGEVNQDNKTVYINWDAIEMLPDQYEAVVSEMIFNFKKLDEYFSNVGSKDNPSWYPRTETAYKIAEMCGISGCDEKTIEQIYEDVDSNMLNIGEKYRNEEILRRRKVGIRVTKKSMRFCEDGSWRFSSPCSNDFNFWNRACQEFLTEEDYTDNYTHQDKFKNPFKYNTKTKRLKRLYELEKFATQQAETKAFVKTVRELAGLPTGFKTDDLKDGKLVFVKYVKSKSYLKAEMAAKLSAISQGKTGEIKQLGNEVFGEQKQIEQPILDNDTEPDFDSEPEQPEQPRKTDQQEIEELKKVLNAYIDDKPENKNRKVIEGKTGALSAILSAIKKKNASVGELKNILDKVEKLKHITKIELPDPETDYFQGDGEW